MGDFLKSINDFNNNISAIGNGIGTTYYYVTHLDKLVILIWNTTVSLSFPVCLVICLTGMTLSIIGFKKPKQWAKISFFSYIAIQIFNMVI